MPTIVRAFSEDQIVFTLQQDGAGYDLSAASKVALHRKDSRGTWDVVDTVSNPTVLAITTAASGIVTLTPTATYWDDSHRGYQAYFEVTVGGKNYTFPVGGRPPVEWIEFQVIEHKP